jgi:hypothetical protein
VENIEKVKGILSGGAFWAVKSGETDIYLK